MASPRVISPAPYSNLSCDLTEDVVRMLNAADRASCGLGCARLFRWGGFCDGLALRERHEATSRVELEMPL